MARKEHPQGKGAEKRSAKKVATPIAADMTPMSWTHKKRKLSGTFKVLSPAILNDVPEELRASAKVRMHFFRECVKALKALPKNVVNKGFVPALLPWNILYFLPGELGRETRFDAGHIGGIVADYHDNSANAVRVSMLPIYDEAGRQVDATFNVTNGWHSRCVALENGLQDNPSVLLNKANPVLVQVEVSLADSTIQIAEAFDDQNKGGVRSMSPRDSWRNRYHSTKADAVYAVNLAAEYGLDASSPKYKRGKNIFPNGSVVHKLINGSDNGLPLCHETHVRQAMELITNATCTGVVNNKRSLDQNFFGGLCHFISMLVTPGYAHVMGLKHVLARVNLHDRIAELVKGMSEAKVAQLLNVRSRKERSEANFSREENMRYLKKAAAIAELYRESVPEPHTKGGTWEECPPALRRLLWEAPEIDDADERRRFVMAQQRLLPKTRNKAVKPLTR
jgi:hypothetical protein